MRLGLSSAAAPDASLEELFTICDRRGLRALELVAGHGHGMSACPDASIEPIFAGSATTHGVISAYLVESVADPCRLADFSRRFGAAIVLAGSGAADERAPEARGIVEHGGRAALLLRGAAAAFDVERLTATNLPFCWEVDPATERITGESLHSVLRRKEALHSVRLLGGGPETSIHDGKGVDALLRELALASWQGDVIIAPSSSRYRVVWQHWLGRRGGWGCSSAGAGKAAVPLAMMHDDGGPT